VTVDASVLSRLNDKQARFLVWQKRWGKTARPNQVPEVAAKLQGKDPQFTECGYLAGRGYGKTASEQSGWHGKYFWIHQGSTAR
jgi:hypothetical protein